MGRKRLLKRGWFGDTVSYLYLTVLAIVAAFPLMWILLSSVKGKGEMIGDPTAFFPKTLTLDNFRTVIGQLHFGSNMGISTGIFSRSTTVPSQRNLLMNVWESPKNSR